MKHSLLAKLSWLRIANLFVPQLPPDAYDILRSDSDEEDEELQQAWQEVETFICMFVVIYPK